MREYIDISLDRFDGENLDSTVYFLSHKHEGEFPVSFQPAQIYRMCIGEARRDLRRLKYESNLCLPYCCACKAPYM